MHLPGFASIPGTSSASSAPIRMDTWHSIPAPTAEDSSSDLMSVSSTSTEPEKSYAGQGRRRRGRPRRTNASGNNLINFTHPENNNGLPPPPDNNNQGYSCSICSKTFTALPSVQRHELTHTENAKPFSCDMCEQKFTQSSSLNTHKRVIHLGEKLFTCQICTKSFGKNDGLKKHLETHARKTGDSSSDQRYSCSICSKKFIALANAKRHELAHTTENAKPFSCDLCELKFSHSSSLNTHKRVIHQGLKLFICQICTKSFGKNGGLQSHLEAHANKTIDAKGNRQKEQYSCSACPAIFFSYQYQIFADHLQTIHGITHTEPEEQIESSIKYYRCTYCPMKYLKIQLFRDHLKCHKIRIEQEQQRQDGSPAGIDDLIPTLVSAAAAAQPDVPIGRGKLLPLVSATKVELLKHYDPTIELPTCSTCGKSFTALKSLQSHSKIHGERKHACSVCSRQFSKPSELRQHERTLICGKKLKEQQQQGRDGNEQQEDEKRENPFRVHPRKAQSTLCTICQKFISKKSIRNHVRTVHLGKKQYVSKYCQQSFTELIPCQRHEKTHEEQGICRIFTRSWQCPICGIEAPNFPSAYLANQHFMEKHNRELKIPVEKIVLKPVNPGEDENLGAWELCAACGNCYTVADYRLHQALCGDTPFHTRLAEGFGWRDEDEPEGVAGESGDEKNGELEKKKYAPCPTCSRTYNAKYLRHHQNQCTAAARKDRSLKRGRKTLKKKKKRTRKESSSESVDDEDEEEEQEEEEGEEGPALQGRIGYLPKRVQCPHCQKSIPKIQLNRHIRRAHLGKRKRVAAAAAADLQAEAEKAEEDVITVKIETEDEVDHGIGEFDWMVADAVDFSPGLIDFDQDTRALEMTEHQDLSLDPLLENFNPVLKAVTPVLSEDEDEIFKTPVMLEGGMKAEVQEQVQAMVNGAEKEPDGEEVELEKEQECPICGLTFKNKPEFLAHDSLEHRRGAVSLTRMSFKSLQDEPEYQSPCFRGISVLQASKDTLHIPWYTCEKCGRSSKLKSQILGHKRVALAERDICPPTKLDGIFKPKLISNDPRIKLLDNGKAQCTICDKIYANIKKHLPAHEGKWDCPYCGRKLSGNAAYRDHLSTHTGEMRYKCDKCDKACASAPMLHLHKQSAHQNRIYECDLCPYSGKYESFYHHVKTKHQDNSSAIKFRRTTKFSKLVVERDTAVPSILACDQCPNIFKSRLTLARHLATVHGQDERQVAAAGIHKPSGYPCEHCGKLIADKTGLQRHILVFHRTDGLKVKFFSCKLCQKEYSLISSMRHHLRSAHAQEIPTQLLEQELAHGEDPEGKSTVLDIENYFVRLKPPINN